MTRSNIPSQTKRRRIAVNRKESRSLSSAAHDDDGRSNRTRENSADSEIEHGWEKGVQTPPPRRSPIRSPTRSPILSPTSPKGASTFREGRIRKPRDEPTELPSSSRDDKSERETVLDQREGDVGNPPPSSPSDQGHRSWERETELDQTEGDVGNPPASSPRDQGHRSSVEKSPHDDRGGGYSEMTLGAPITGGRLQSESVLKMTTTNLNVTIDRLYNEPETTVLEVFYQLLGASRLQVIDPTLGLLPNFISVVMETVRQLNKAGDELTQLSGEYGPAMFCILQLFYRTFVAKAPDTPDKQDQADKQYCSDYFTAFPPKTVSKTALATFKTNLSRFPDILQLDCFKQIIDFEKLQNDQDPVLRLSYLLNDASRSYFSIWHVTGKCGRSRKDAKLRATNSEFLLFWLAKYCQEKQGKVMSVKGGGGKGKKVVDQRQTMIESGTEAQITRFLLREDQPLITKYENEVITKATRAQKLKATELGAEATSGTAGTSDPTATPNPRPGPSTGASSSSASAAKSKKKVSKRRSRDMEGSEECGNESHDETSTPPRDVYTREVQWEGTSYEIPQRFLDKLLSKWLLKEVREEDGVINLQRILKIEDEIMNSLDPKLVEMYDVSQYDNRLGGLLLSQSGFYVTVNKLQHPVSLKKGMDDAIYEATPGVFAEVQKDAMQIAMCPECWKHISGENSTSLSPKKPAEAIANGNWIGYLPEEFVNVSRTTESVVSLMQPCIYLSSVIGNSSGKTIKSHHYISVFDQPVLRHLPAMPWDHLRVTFVGSFATEEFAQMQARYSVQEFAGDLLSFFEKHNKWHKQHADLIRPAAAGNYDFGDGHIDRTDTSSVPVNEHLVQMLNHTTYNTGCADTAFEEATAHILHSSRGNPDVEQTQAEAGDDGSADYAVCCSSRISKARNLANIPLFFPTLMPFGLGGPSMDREVHLSPQRWAKRCLKLHAGNFQEHWGFTAIIYDYIATNEAFAKQYLSMSL
ncbi:hypothetical protein BJ741DRAFT_694540 [Chytriomyces cf. hyalinus JEL632]|nr:hypothetical protein BJ741DRAFT_694540 [Chytriomyces cf. hyalinus JEL632]